MSLYSGVFSLFAGVSLFFAATTATKWLEPSAKISIDVNSWKWMGAVRIGLNEVELPALPPTPAIRMPEKRVRVLKELSAAKVARAKKAADQITVSAARAVPVITKSAATPSAAEYETFRTLHSLWRMRFVSALNEYGRTPPVIAKVAPAVSKIAQAKVARKVPARLVSQKDVAPAPVTTHAEATKQVRLAKAALVPQELNSKLIIEKPGDAKNTKNVTKKAKGKAFPDFQPTIIAKRVSTKAPEEAEPVRAEAARIAKMNEAKPEAPVRAPPEALPEVPTGVTRTIETARVESPVVSIQMAEQALKPVNTQSDANLVIPEKTSEQNSDDYPRNGYPAVIAGPTLQDSILYTRSAPTRPTVLAGPAPISPPSPGRPDSDKKAPQTDQSPKRKPEALAQASANIEQEATQEGVPDAKTKSISLMNRRPSENTVLQSSGPAVPVHPSAAIEAFDWQTSVPGTTIEKLTREFLSPGTPKAGWQLAKAAEHWSTLSWTTGQDTAPVPLISSAAAFLLSKISQATILRETGIVFGKVPAGWKVELSGRAEQPVFLNGQNKLLSGEKSSEDRYFVFLNVNPGAHLIFAARDRVSETGALGVPVLRGVATYVDLSAPQKKKISGQVFDASSGIPRGVFGARVRIVGQTKEAVTRPNGAFEIENIIVIGQYPVFVETEVRTGYTHRYRLMPGHLDQVSLFRLSPQQVDEWLGQLEGGISADGGLVVAAVPQIVASRPQDRLVPALMTLVDRQSLTPETYTVMASGQMREDLPLTATATRFISLQVPEGPVVAEIRDKNKNQVWSELIIASPGVINLVGPY
ncbi:MAG TPA: hypothetical protein VJB59_07665 [Bdellovibrionota bacterium]|nr:hypothetical protein [Bdellovibrionota bacterium]